MFFKSYQLYFMALLMVGTTIASTSNSWFTCWLGLEINLMSIIPLILSELNFKSTESAIKYFLVQAMASVLLVAAACLEYLCFLSSLMSNFNTIIFLALAIKAGLAPFHLWFPQVIKHISWFKCSIVFLWQKIAPFTLMSSFYSKPMFLLFIVLSSFFGAVGGLNQTETKLLLTYSSIAHSAWLLALTFSSVFYWGFYFLLYSLILAPIIVSFHKNNFLKTSGIFNSKLPTQKKNSLTFMILSLGGLPPFLGFTAKLFTLTVVMGVLPLYVILAMVASSLVSLFFYMKMFYNLAMNSSTENKMNLGRQTFKATTLMTVSLTGNLILSIMVLLT